MGIEDMSDWAKVTQGLGWTSGLLSPGSVLLFVMLRVGKLCIVGVPEGLLEAMKGHGVPKSPGPFHNTLHF